MQRASKRAALSNAEIARALREMALFLELEAAPFKPQAYENAAYAVSAFGRPLAELYNEGGAKALSAVSGVGKGIAERVAGMLETGRLEDLERLRKKTPIDLLALTSVGGIGAKKAHALWQALDVHNIAELKRAALRGRIRPLSHFGPRSEQKILEALAFYEETTGRRPLGQVLEQARKLEAALAEMPGVTQACVAGSIRRHRETIGDVDLLVATHDPERVCQGFGALAEVETLLAQGPTKTSVRLTNGMDADLRVLAPDSFGAALLYFTGSKAHNVTLRKLAQKKGLKLNEYGLFRGAQRIAGKTEQDVYRALGLSFIPPELREDRGEIPLAQEGRLPRLLEARQIRGDLHVHSRANGSSIAAMARAARELGREYIVIADRARDLVTAEGLDEARLRQQIQEIRKLERELGGIRLLAGVDVNIRTDGSLDLRDELLAELDVVGAAVYTHLDQPRAEMTQRVLRAIENPHVDLLFHPLGRALGKRRAIELDFERVAEACARTGTILEVDAQPERLDLPDALVRRALEAGARIAVDSDAQNIEELRFVETYGVGLARRGWARPAQVVNTLPVDALLAALKSPTSPRSAQRTRRRRASASPSPTPSSTPSSLHRARPP